MTTRFSKKRVDPASVFAPWVTPDQRNLVASSNVYTAVLKLCYKLGVKCVQVSNDTIAGVLNVRFGTETGLRVANLSIQNSARTTIHSALLPDSYLCATGFTSSKNPMYAASRVLKTDALARAVSAARTFDRELVCRIFMAARKHVANQYPYDATSAKVDSATAGWLLRLYAREVTDADIPAHVRTAADKALKAAATVHANLDKCMGLLREMFCRDKWIIGYSNSIGYWVAKANLSKVYDKYMHYIYEAAPADPGDVYDAIAPLQFYPTFESIPESLRREIAPSQAMLNMYLDGTGSTVQFTGPERLIPKMSETWFDAGAGAYTFNTGIAGSWLVMDTV